MSAVLEPATRQAPPVSPGPEHAPRLALLGTGTVGAAFAARCERLRARGVAVPALAWLANSRGGTEAGGRPLQALEALRAAPFGAHAAEAPWAGALGPGDVVVDATASDGVADRHAGWLAEGIHVVTANKQGAGAELARARAIAAASRACGATYGDSATVGAGLPLLRSVRALAAGGDAIHSIEGVLSGSLAWLFDRFDGARPFSALVREVHAAGYTEPDPRLDLSGEDVKRKLLILVRAAGLELEAHDVRVSPLLPAALAAAGPEEVEGLLPLLDAPMQERLERARRAGMRLCFAGRWSEGIADVGLRELPAAHPLCAGGGTDNLVAITSCRYRAQPLVIRGPGAGAEVTAAALLDDVLSIPQR